MKYSEYHWNVNFGQWAKITQSNVLRMELDFQGVVVPGVSKNENSFEQEIRGI